MDDIINKVANSNLEIFDLEDYYQDGKRMQIDISVWLEGGYLLREKDFRLALKKHDWTKYASRQLRSTDFINAKLVQLKSAILPI